MTDNDEPNPEQWTDANGAARLLGKSRPTVYDMTDRGVITQYRVGAARLYWVPQIQRVAKAITMLAARRG